MSFQRLCRSGYPYWAVSFSMLITCALTQDASARSYKRRVRAVNECKSEKQVSEADADKSRRYFESGMIYYQTKDYVKARDEFRIAYEISNAPDFLVNLASVSSKLRAYGDAVKYLDQYIAECPNSPDLSAAIQRRDDMMIAQTIKEGEEPPPERIPPPPKPALALMGAGAGLLLIGAGLGGGAIAAAKQVGAPDGIGVVREFDENWAAIESRGKSLSAAAIALDVVGGAALAAGAIWTGLWYQQRDGISLTLAPRPGGILVLGRF